MKINLSNRQIWEYTQNLKKNFDKDDLIFPAKISYAIQNNLIILLEKYELIENTRMLIGKKYGIPNEDKSSYRIPVENLEKAQQELDELLEVEQKVNLIILSLDEIENCSFSMSQMKAIHFMLDKDSYDNEKE